MKRIHAFEWEDQPWFPKSWRDYGTDYLRFIASRFDIYEPVLPLIRKGLDASGGAGWVDMASGGGSNLSGLARTLNSSYPELKIVLTDYFPNTDAFEKTCSAYPAIFQFESEKTDARYLPDKFRGKFRTIFGAFHHFRPEDAAKILQDAVDSKSPVAVFEPVGRNFFSWFSMLFVIPNVLLLTPFIRPVRWTVLPFIYLVPVIPLYVLWDGIVSILRTYSKRELDDLILTLKNSDTFNWEVGHQKGKPASIGYLLGTPK